METLTNRGDLVEHYTKPWN